MNKGEALIGTLPSISLAAVTITTGFAQVMHVHQGRLWGQVTPGYFLSSANKAARNFAL